ncbi:rab GTPase-activating protein 1-like, isoform 10-like [Platysternon megacephalum]|uniref:Rab GTPase-activating protein 1-like, isoform 10-like n=1 Tax=Platysternon megacephalum TaxID=55544 RepID=A0A4D9EJV2_9SAUR|nr:rab GTPase-activating protein 1-like, isoform 10-like [Platysternon megacephalum]
MSWIGNQKGIMLILAEGRAMALLSHFLLLVSLKQKAHCPEQCDDTTSRTVTRSSCVCHMIKQITHLKLYMVISQPQGNAHISRQTTVRRTMLCSHYNKI